MYEPGSGACVVRDTHSGRERLETRFYAAAEWRTRLRVRPTSRQVLLERLRWGRANGQITLYYHLPFGPASLRNPYQKDRSGGSQPRPVRMTQRVRCRRPARGSARAGWPQCRHGRLCHEQPRVWVRPVQCPGSACPGGAWLDRGRAGSWGARGTRAGLFAGAGFGDAADCGMAAAQISLCASAACL